MHRCCSTYSAGAGGGERKREEVEAVVSVVVVEGGGGGEWEKGLERLEEDEREKRRQMGELSAEDGSLYLAEPPLQGKVRIKSQLPRRGGGATGGEMDG